MSLDTQIDTASKVHKMALFYTTEDDGIHLGCIEKDCGADRILGHAPLVGRVIEAFAEHQKEVAA